MCNRLSGFFRRLARLETIGTADDSETPSPFRPPLPPAAQALIDRSCRLVQDRLPADLPARLAAARSEQERMALEMQALHKAKMECPEALECLHLAYEVANGDATPPACGLRELPPDN
ncbi:MAG: hypothetical protein ACYC3I_06480 [Gemmataceae bacterium]